ncbi:MAG: hypothetical protein QM796_21870 [Chthoniobacteraceae bacterium]
MSLQGLEVAELRILGEGGEGVVAGAEAVHEQEAQVGAGRFAEVQHLFDNEIEEAHPVANGEERLGALQAHAGAEAAVELEHRGLREELGARGDRLRDGGEIGQGLDGGDGGLGDHPGLIRLKHLVAAFKRTDRRFCHSGGFHFFPKVF